MVNYTDSDDSDIDNECFFNETEGGYWIRRFCRHKYEVVNILD